MRARDTTPEAHEVQIAIYRKLGPSGRFLLGVKMAEEIRQLTAAGIRSRHPEYTDQEVWFALLRLSLGPELFREAWPDALELDP